MIGKLTRLMLTELQLQLDESIGKLQSITGDLNHEVRVGVEPEKASEFAIMSTMKFVANAEDGGAPPVTASCSLIGYFSVGRRLVLEDTEQLMDEIRTRVDLQMYALTREKLIGLMGQAGINSQNFAPEQHSEGLEDIQIPVLSEATAKKKTKKKRISKKKASAKSP